MQLKKHRFLPLVAFAGLAMIAASAAFAGNSNSLRVTASITGTCNFNTADDATNGNATLAFGALDQTLTTDATATTATLQYWCTNGTAVTTFTASNGLNTTGCTGTRCLSNGTDLIPYTLTFTCPVGNAGSGKTTPIDVDFDGSILNADYVDAEAGNYTDTVTLTIAP